MRSSLGEWQDIDGKPFVGPAGGVLARALEGAEIDAKDVYLTNAVKHFKWRARDKRPKPSSVLRSGSPAIAAG
jgi:uracil-DNA glycosylase family 4